MTVAAPSRPHARPTSDYHELARQVREAGLLRRRPLYYAAKMSGLLAAYVVTGWAFVTIGASWWQLALAVGLGVLLTQTAYLSHDAAHRQIFTSGRANDWAALVISDLFVGLSHGWWQRKHSRHHAKPNQIGADPDIGTGALVFIPEDVPTRRGFAAWFVRRQGWLFFPLITLEGLALHVTAIRTVFGREPVKHRAVEITFLLVRIVGYLTAVFWVLPVGMGVAFVGVQLAVFGFYMGATFAPNHKGMPLVPADVRIDFLRRQVLMSRNISGSRVVDVAMGGLNHQIEHHLFPSMPRPSLRRAKPMVRAYCAARGITYTETTLLGSYRIVVRYLNDVGLGRMDPFECPVTAQFRTR
ncbi:fatty acid desaturase family protein [Occultella gossypii]|uniref:Acyl-CoA desaturase n=1 Tax=Occultella gossypii TaxID=2800820 RepID=A0ABS7SB99_9MICO|nr:acyl-CoA desaturase [Occultella gossypii]MBZ2197639.1 acyl-CoA desaturase [Occultella gossypii]